MHVELARLTWARVRTPALTDMVFKKQVAHAFCETPYESNDYNLRWIRQPGGDVTGVFDVRAWMLEGIGGACVPQTRIWTVCSLGWLCLKQAKRHHPTSSNEDYNLARFSKQERVNM